MALVTQALLPTSHASHTAHITARVSTRSPVAQLFSSSTLAPWNIRSVQRSRCNGPLPVHAEDARAFVEPSSASNASRVTEVKHIIVEAPRREIIPLQPPVTQEDYHLLLQHIRSPVLQTIVQQLQQDQQQLESIQQEVDQLICGAQSAGRKKRGRPRKTTTSRTPVDAAEPAATEQGTTRRRRRTTTRKQHSAGVSTTTLASGGLESMTAAAQHSSSTTSSTTSGTTSTTSPAEDFSHLEQLYPAAAQQGALQWAAWITRCLATMRALHQQLRKQGDPDSADWLAYQQQEQQAQAAIKQAYDIVRWGFSLHPELQKELCPLGLEAAVGSMPLPVAAAGVWVMQHVNPLLN